ncbi:MAG: hypothetical protein LBN25_03910 [Christensenellaceae bacterium]|jgi:hypothetical protein|nr:hypothetical protein [Christensenellaceae bacterium]
MKEILDVMGQADKYVLVFNIVISLLFFAVLAYQAFKGSRRGLERQAVKTGSVLLALILAVVTTPAILTAILKAAINSFGESLENLPAGTGTLISNNVGIAVIFAGIFFLFVLYAVYRFVFWLVYIIIANILFKKGKFKHKKGVQRPLFRVLGGAGIGVIHGAIVLIIPLMLFALLGSFSNTIYDSLGGNGDAVAAIYDDQNEEPLTAAQKDEIDKSLKTSRALYNSSAPGVFIGWAQRAAYNGATTYKFNDGKNKTNISDGIDLIGEIIAILPKYSEIKVTVDAIDEGTATREDLSAVVDAIFTPIINLLDNNLLNAIADVATADDKVINDLLGTKDENGEASEPDELTTLLNNIVKAYKSQGLLKGVANDLKLLKPVFIDLINDGFLDSFVGIESETSSDPFEMVDSFSDKTIDDVANAMTAILMREALVYVFNDMIPEAFGAITEDENAEYSKFTSADIDWDAEKSAFAAALKSMKTALALFPKGEDGAPDFTAYMEMESDTSVIDEQLGNALNLLLDLQLIKGGKDGTNVKVLLDGLRDNMLQETFDSIGIPRGSIHLDKVNFVALFDILHTFKGVNLEEGNISASEDKIVSLITKVEALGTESGFPQSLDAIMGYMLKNMDIEGIDDELLKNPDGSWNIGVAQNKVAIGAFVTLFNDKDGYEDAFANVDDLSADDDVSQYDDMIAALNKIRDNSTGNFVNISNKLVVSFIPSLSESDDAIGTLTQSIRAIKKIQNASNYAKAVQNGTETDKGPMSVEDASALIDELADPFILDYVEENLSNKSSETGIGIGLSADDLATFNEQIDAKITSDPDKTEEYERIRALFIEYNESFED